MVIHQWSDALGSISICQRLHMTVSVLLVIGQVVP